MLNILKLPLIILASVTLNWPTDAPQGYTPYLATAYCLKGRTASGMRTRQGIVAADPRVLRLGTRIHVHGMGDYVVADTGKKIKGHRLDLWYPTSRQARNFGKQRVLVTIIKD